MPRLVMEASDTEVIKRLVESGFGYSILPEYALKGANEAVPHHAHRRPPAVRSQALAR